jgi:hypothetical protein
MMKHSGVAASFIVVATAVALLLAPSFGVGEKSGSSVPAVAAGNNPPATATPPLAGFTAETLAALAEAQRVQVEVVLKQEAGEPQVIEVRQAPAPAAAPAQQSTRSFSAPAPLAPTPAMAPAGSRPQPAYTSSPLQVAPTQAATTVPSSTPRPTLTPTRTPVATSTAVPTATPVLVQGQVTINFAGAPQPRATVSEPFSVQPGANAWVAIQDAIGVQNITYQDFGGSLGIFITGFYGMQAQGNHFWAFYVNGVSANVGVSSYITRAGDVIEFRYDSF